MLFATTGLEWVKNGMLGKIEIEALRPTLHAVKLDVEPGPRRLGLLGWKRKRNLLPNVSYSHGKAASGRLCEKSGAPVFRGLFCLAQTNLARSEAAPRRLIVRIIL